MHPEFDNPPEELRKFLNSFHSGFSDKAIGEIAFIYRKGYFTQQIIHYLETKYGKSQNLVYRRRKATERPQKGHRKDLNPSRKDLNPSMSNLLERISRTSASDGQRVGREYIPLFVIKFREEEKQILIAALSLYYAMHPAPETPND